VSSCPQPKLVTAPRIVSIFVRASRQRPSSRRRESTNERFQNASDVCRAGSLFSFIPGAASGLSRNLATRDGGRLEPSRTVPRGRRRRGMWFIDLDVGRRQVMMSIYSWGTWAKFLVFFFFFFFFFFSFYPPVSSCGCAQGRDGPHAPDAKPFGGKLLQSLMGEEPVRWYCGFVATSGDEGRNYLIITQPAWLSSPISPPKSHAKLCRKNLLPSQTLSQFSSLFSPSYHKEEEKGRLIPSYEGTSFQICPWNRNLKARSLALGRD
jgi:hypothetical protein